MESCSTLASEQKNLIVRNLVGKAHVAGDPARLVNLWSADLLPNVARDVIHFDGVDDPLLVNTTAESEDVIVLEHT